MHAETWKVGELAKRTRLSVRTLHYYEEIGLLRPSARTEAGHRLYTAADVERLQCIVSLRQLGVSLADIQDALATPDFALGPVLDLHLAKLGEHIAMQQRLHQRLSTLRAQVADGRAIPASQFLKTMEAISMIDKYLTPEQIKLVAEQRDQYRATFGKEAAEGFQTFLAALRSHLQAGDDPTREPVQALARAWIANRHVFGSEEQAIGRGLQKMLSEESEVRQRLGLDDALFAYLKQVMAHVQQA